MALSNLLQQYQNDYGISYGSPSGLNGADKNGVYNLIVEGLRERGEFFDLLEPGQVVDSTNLQGVISSIESIAAQSPCPYEVTGNVTSMTPFSDLSEFEGRLNPSFASDSVWTVKRLEFIIGQSIPVIQSGSAFTSQDAWWFLKALSLLTLRLNVPVTISGKDAGKEGRSNFQLDTTPSFGQAVTRYNDATIVVDVLPSSAGGFSFSTQGLVSNFRVTRGYNQDCTYPSDDLPQIYNTPTQVLAAELHILAESNSAGVYENLDYPTVPETGLIYLGKSSSPISVPAWKFAGGEWVPDMPDPQLGNLGTSDIGNYIGAEPDPNTDKGYSWIIDSSSGSLQRCFWNYEVPNGYQLVGI